MHRWPILLLCVLAASCSEKRYTAEECGALASPKAYVDRCLGGRLNGEYIGDRNCWPFAHSRLHGVLWSSGDENAGFYPNAMTFEDTKKSDPKIWPENAPGMKLPPSLANLQPTFQHAWLVDAEGEFSQCDGWFGHLSAYRREFIINKFHSVKEIPLR